MRTRVFFFTFIYAVQANHHVVYKVHYSGGPLRAVFVGTPHDQPCGNKIAMVIMSYLRLILFNRHAYNTIKLHERLIGKCVYTYARISYCFTDERIPELTKKSAQHEAPHQIVCFQ